MNPLCAVSQKHQDQLMISPESKKYVYDVVPVTVADPVPRRFGAIKIDDMLEQRGSDLFLRKEFALAFVNSHHRRFRHQKLADSDESGTD